MVNAVAHGNRYNANKKVRFSVASDTQRFTVRIADEGDGFDFSHLPDPRLQENLMRASGRGIFSSARLWMSFKSGAWSLWAPR